jgi:hypothetical protein
MEIKCPFTNTLICDGGFYFEPFSGTLICYYVEGSDFNFLLPGIEVVEKVATAIEDANESCQNLGIEGRFSWLPSPITTISTFELFSAHPLIKEVVDDTDYGPKEMNEGGLYIFWFALPIDHGTILKEFNNLLDFIEEQQEN